MRTIILLGWFLSGFLLHAAESNPAIQKGRLASVQLLDVSRVLSRGGGEAPDGVSFRFFVTRNEGAIGTFTIKETRDVRVAGKSYEQGTRAALGKSFEPDTVVDSAGKFFANRTDLAPPVNAKLSDALVVSLSFRGAELKPGEKLQVVLHVGFGREVDDLIFDSEVPGPTAAKK